MLYLVFVYVDLFIHVNLFIRLFTLYKSPVYANALNRKGARAGSVSSVSREVGMGDGRGEKISNSQAQHEYKHKGPKNEKEIHPEGYQLIS